MAMLINLFPKHNWRLRHHLQAPSGNITDPNGLCQFNGEYHVFHQYVPRWPKIGHGWGHWVSKDLLTWHWLGGAIMPSCEYDEGGSYSGSAVERDGALWCYYTGNVLEPGDYDYDYAGRQANETLTITRDGRTFGEKVPVLRNPDYPAYCSNHVRDPKVWEQDGCLHMMLGARTRSDHGCVLLYRSDDGVSWQLEGTCTSASGKPFGYMWECPNVAELGGREYLFVCPQGVPKQEYAYQNIHVSGYFPLPGRAIDLLSGDQGLMDAEAPFGCIDETTFVELDYGFDFYAPQLFTDKSGRTMLTAWVGVPDIELQYEVPTEGWAHTITMLREVTVNSAGRVCQWPVAEMDGLRLAEAPFTAEAAHGASGLMGSSDYDLYTMEGAVGARFDGVADVTIEDIEGPGRLMLNGDLELVVDDREADLVFLGQAGRFRTLRRMPLSALSAGRIESLRVMVDTSVVEVFINGGEVTMTTRWFPLDIANLAVTSTFAGEHHGWALRDFTYENVG